MVPAATAAGTFAAGAAVTMTLQASPPMIRGDGSSLSAVTARFRDAFGNTVTSTAGSVTFTAADGDFAALHATTAQVQNGTATVILQAKVTEYDGKVQITATVDQTAGAFTAPGAVAVDGGGDGFVDLLETAGAIYPWFVPNSVSGTITAVRYEVRESAGAWVEITTVTAPTWTPA